MKKKCVIEGCNSNKILAKLEDYAPSGHAAELRALNFPSATLCLHRRGRDRKHDRVGLRNEPAETILQIS